MAKETPSKEEILQKLSEIAEKTKSTHIFTNRFHSLRPILSAIRKIIEDFKSYSELARNKLLKLNESLSNISKVIDNYADIGYCASILKDDTPISKLKDKNKLQMNNIIECIQELFQIGFNLPSYDSDGDIQQINHFLNGPNFENDEQFANRRKEIEKLLKEINKPISLVMDEYDSKKQYRLPENSYTRSNLIETNNDYDKFEGKRDNQDINIIRFKKQDNFENLFHVLSTIQHPNLERFLGAAITDSNVELVTEKKGTKLRDQPDLPLTLIALKIAQSLSYLHSKRIVHRDINIDNIFIYDKEPIITNFTKSHYMHHWSFLGLPNIKSRTSFISPELSNSHSYDEKVDVFGFGGVLYELCTGSPPFKSEEEEGKDISALILGGKRPTFPPNVQREVVDIIESCWHQNADKRPSFDQIIDSMCLNEILFSNDSKHEEAVAFYSTNSIKLEKIAYCSCIFDSVIDFIDKVDQFKFEFHHARSILFEYKHLIREKFTNKEKFEGNEEALIDSLMNEQLMNIMHGANCTSLVPIFSDGQKINYITDQLTNAMDEVYQTILALGISKDKTQKYEPDSEDLAFDYFDLNFYLKYNYDQESCAKWKKKSDIFINQKNLEPKIKPEKLYPLLKRLFSPFKSWEVNRGDFYYKKEKIDEGYESAVFEGTQISTNEKVAIKVIKDDYLDSLRNLINLRREIGYLTEIKHKYIAKFYGFSLSNEGMKIWMIMQFIPGENLFFKKEKLNEYQKTKVAFQIAEGMEYLHSKKILHRDLKPQNVLLMDDLTPKIIDFGYARSNVVSMAKKSNNIGTAYYMAPEVCIGKQYSLAADVFSFAMSLWELYENDFPFSDLSQQEALISILSKLRPKFSNNQKIQPSLKKLIEDGWNHEPSERPSFTEIINRMIDEKISFLPAVADEGKEEELEEMRKQIDEFYEDQKTKRNADNNQ